MIAFTLTFCALIVSVVAPLPFNQGCEATTVPRIPPSDADYSKCQVGATVSTTLSSSSLGGPSLNGKTSPLVVESPLPVTYRIVTPDSPKGPLDVQARVKTTCAAGTPQRTALDGVTMSSSTVDGVTTVTVKLATGADASLFATSATSPQAFYDGDCYSDARVNAEFPDRRKQAIAACEAKKATTKVVADTATPIAATTAGAQPTTAGPGQTSAAPVVTTADPAGTTAAPVQTTADITDNTHSPASSLVSPLASCLAVAAALLGSVDAAPPCVAFVEVAIPFNTLYSGTLATRQLDVQVKGFGSASTSFAFSLRQIAIGRPFVLDDGESVSTDLRTLADNERASTALARDATSCATTADVVDAAVAELLASPDAHASQWVSQAVAEHTSIASFAAFTLQLMSNGAPSVLLAAATRAAGDEVRHGDACFSVARALGANVGAAAFPPAAVDALTANSLEQLALGALREGAVAETVSTLDAARQSDDAANNGMPGVAALWRAIAIDEARHSALAWRTVAWAIAQDESLRAVVQSELEHLLAVNDDDSFYQMVMNELVRPIARRVVDGADDAASIEQLLAGAADADARASHSLAVGDSERSFVSHVIAEIVGSF